MSDVAGGLSPADEAAFAAMQNEEPVQPETEETEQPESEPLEAAAEPEETDEQPAEGKKPSMVPHAALHQERERNKRLAQELQQAREERARFDERLRVIQEMQQPAKKAEPEPIPDPDQDPIAALKWMTQQLQERQRQEAERSRQSDEERQREENNQRFISAYRTQAGEYIRENPDAQEAYNTLVTNLREEFELQGYSQAEAVEQAKQYEANIAWGAMQRGANPMQTMVELARKRGWAPKAKTQEAEQRVETVAAGAARNKTLSTAGGASATTEMTVERLLSMSSDEFDTWTGKNPAKARRLMGG